MMRISEVLVIGGIAALSGFGPALHAQSYDAAPDFYVVNEDVEDIIMDVTANDLNTTGVTDIYLLIATPPLYGSVSVDDVNDLLVYTPNPDFNGTDNFEYTGCAIIGPDICGTTSVIITVNPLPDYPIAVDDAIETFVNTPINVEPLLNDIDVDDEGIEFEILDDADFGATTIIGGEFVFYEPFSDVFGEDCFTYRICKIGSVVYCDTATVCVDVLSTNLFAPVAVNDTFVVVIGDTLNLGVLWNDFDSDLDGLSITSLIFDGTTGIISISYPDSVNYSATEVGPDDFGYVVCDDNIPSLCDTAYVRVKVNEPEIVAEIVHVPNSFSPNGDGFLDQLIISGLDENVRFNIKIYDRWSNLIFENQNENVVWDGTTNVEFLSTAGAAPEGTYFYVLRIDGLVDPMSGFIVLKR